VPGPGRAFDLWVLQPLVLVLACWLAALDTLWRQGPGLAKGRVPGPAARAPGTAWLSLVTDLSWLLSWWRSGAVLWWEVGRGLVGVAGSVVALLVVPGVALMVALAQRALVCALVSGDWALGMVTGSWLEQFTELFGR
jgi:hypothetical protein